MDAQVTNNPGDDNCANGERNKEELMRVGELLLVEKTDEKRDAIKKAANICRAQIYERLKQVTEIENADLRVCQVRFDREIAQLREAIYGGEKFIPGPIRKLPMELLSYTFRYYVDSGFSPWILAKVSKSWMRTAMGTPHLWSYLLLTTTRNHMHKLQEYLVDGRVHACVDNWQVCRDDADVESALHRSGAVPLNIRVEHDGRFGNETFQPLLLEVFGGYLSKRVYSIDIACLRANFAPDITSASFPELRVLKLLPTDVQWLSRLLKVVDRSSVHIEEAFFASDIPSEASTYSFWSRLKYLTLRGIYQAEPFNEVVTQFHDLQTFSHFITNWPNAETPLSTWENIREITITCNGHFLHRLRLPSLETLRLTVMDTLPHTTSMREYDQPSYTMLTTLYLETNHPQWPEYAAGLFPAVIHFTLRTNGGDEMIIAILQTVPKARNVKIAGSPRQSFGLLFLQRLYCVQTMLCPNLETLRLGQVTYETVHTPKREAEPLLKKLAKFRKEIGCPLRELVVRWKYRKEVIDYAESAHNGEA